MPDYIEGRRAVEEALRAGVPITRVLVQESAEGADAHARQGTPHADDATRPGSSGRGGGRKGARTPEAATGRGRQGRERGGRGAGRPATQDALDPLVRRIRSASPDAVVRRVPKGELDAISEHGMSHGAHQGIVVEVPPYRYADIERIARTGGSKPDSLVVMLDHVTDEGNLGAIIRTAEVVGADGVVIPSRRAAQVGVGVYKTSAGAALHLPVARVPNLSAAIATLKEAGYWVAGASEKATHDVWHAPLSGRIVLVMGSEGEGISRLVRQNCDFLVSLPQAGHVGSLNVAQATCAICYEWLRQCTLRRAEAAGADPASGTAWAGAGR